MLDVLSRKFLHPPKTYPAYTVYRLFFKLYIPLTAIVLIGAFTIYFLEKEFELSKIQQAESNAVNTGIKAIEGVIQSIVGDLNYLSRQMAFVESLAGKSLHAQKHVKQDWGAFAKVREIYDQVRWMDKDGHERIRVNYNQGNPIVVADKDLQDKSQRYYFKDVVGLNKAEVFISPLDLNVEQGKIEQPLKPMIRIGMPVFDEQFNKQGVLLLNYRGSAMLSAFQQGMGDAGKRAWLLNRDSYWLKASSPEMEWGFMLDEPHMTMEKHYPAAWKNMLAQTEGQFTDEHGLWTFATLYPLYEGQKTSTGSHQMFAPSRSALTVSEYYWKVVLLLPNQEYYQSVEMIISRLVLVSGILLLGLGYGSWRLSNMWLAKTRAEKALQQMNINLEALINEQTRELRHEIEERKKTGRELMAAKLEAEAANRSKSDFLANMSHEIRNPMNAIMGMTYLALKTPLNDKQQNFIQKAHHAAEGLLGIINDILDFSKIEAGKMELEETPFQLVEVLDKMSSIIQLKAEEKQIKLHIRMDKNIPGGFCGDPLRLSQILINLCNNAVKFSPQNSEVNVNVFSRQLQGDDIELEFQVKDQGIGISEEQQQKLFQPFQQANSSTTREYGGSGLGLTISQQIASMMQGRMWVESELQKGSTFFVCVRLKKIDAMQSRAQPAADQHQLALQANRKLRGAKLLVVEDHPVNRQLVGELLSRSGIAVVFAVNGQEAVDKVDQESFDGVLMDCQMPIMDGYQATRLIRKQNISLPILALTANSMHSDKQKAVDAGMNDHISKPVNPDQMLMTMAKWITPSHPAAADDFSEHTEQSEAEPLALPDIPGVDLQKGLLTVKNDVKFYLQLFCEFYQEYKTFEQTFSQAREHETAAELKRRAHTLKGIAGNMGALQVQQAAYLLEQAYLKQDQNAIEQSLQQVNAQLQIVMKGAEQQEIC